MTKASSTRSRVLSKTEIFFSVFKKNLRSHVEFLNRIWPSTRIHVFSKTEIFSLYSVAFSNRMCGGISLEPRHDVIVFENLRFHTNTINLRFQNSPSWRAYLKTSVFGAWKRQLLVDDSRIRRKKSPFSKIPGYVWTGSNNQGCHGPWKSWKVLELAKENSRPWKVLVFVLQSLKILEWAKFFHF